MNEVTGDVYAARDKFDTVIQFDLNGNVIREWGGTGSEPGQFRFPYDVAVDPTTGNVYVMDAENARVQQFDSGANFIRSFGTPGSGEGQFSGGRVPAGLTFDPDARVLFVTDPRSARILKFDEFGSFLLEWGPEDTPAPGGIRWPRNVALDPAGNVHVTGTDNERIHVFSSQGQFVKVYQGPRNRVQGPFHPRDIAIDRTTGEAYVNNSYAFRIDKFDGSNQFLYSFGSRETYAYAFHFPHGLTVSHTNGDVYVFDSGSFLLKRFTAGGAFLNQWGGSTRIDETGSGLFGQFFNNAVTVDADGLVWTGVNMTHYAGDPSGMFLQQFTP